MRTLLVAALLLVLVAGGAAAQSGERVLASTLDNGLRVLLQEDHRSPIVSFQMWYRVGSRNEARGATGIAHFLEHLMFRGTAANGPGVFARLVERNGGQDNAFTSEDEVVIEERRTRTEDDPGGALGEEVSATAFRAHPYGQPIIGWMADIRRITPEEIRAVYRTYYVPNNALLVVVGDFKADEAL